MIIMMRFFQPPSVTKNAAKPDSIESFWRVPRMSIRYLLML